MQMIADGKIKKDTKFDVLNKRGMTYTANATIDDVTMRELLDLDFEILEDTTEEIEEIKRINKSYAIFGFDDKSFKEMKEMLQDLYEKTDELVREINHIKKTFTVDTSKETNCMSK